LIAALSGQASFADKEDYAPNKSSAQYLADRANRFGVTLSREGRDSLWIGSPLRVHRRCIDPMYSVSNRSARDLRYLTLSRGKECNQERIDIEGWGQSTDGIEIEKMVQ
jgi:hypothetical protein